MKFTFKYLLSNGGVEFYTFTASEFKPAFDAAAAYAALAFNEGELYEFYYSA